MNADSKALPTLMSMSAASVQLTSGFYHNNLILQKTGFFGGGFQNTSSF